MKTALVLDSLARPENPNDVNYSNGMDHYKFRARSNQRVTDFALGCLGVDEVLIKPSETLKFADFCRLLNGDWERIILPGSSHSANDQHIPWIRELKLALVETRHSTRAPIVGICFGAQIWAASQGAEISLLDQPRKGISNIKGLGLEVAVSHTEIIKPTSRMTVFGESDDGLPYLIREESDMAIQPHPEVPLPSGNRTENPWGKLLALE